MGFSLRLVSRGGFCFPRHDVTTMGSGISLDDGNRSQKSIAFSRQSLYIPGSLCVVRECVPDLPDRNPEAVIELDERVVRPQALPYCFAVDDLAWLLNQQHQKPVGQFLQLDPATVPDESSLRCVEFKWTEAIERGQNFPSSRRRKMLAHGINPHR